MSLSVQAISEKRFLLDGGNSVFHLKNALLHSFGLLKMLAIRVAGEKTLWCRFNGKIQNKVLARLKGVDA